MAALWLWLVRNPAIVVIGLLVAALGVQTFRLNSAEAAGAEAKLAFADFKTDLSEKSLKAQQEAAARSAEQVKALTESIRTISQMGQQVKTEIRYVQSNNGPCTADPVWRATVSGVLSILERDSGGGDDKARPQSPPALRRAAAAQPVKIAQ